MRLEVLICPFILQEVIDRKFFLTYYANWFGIYFCNIVVIDDQTFEGTGSSKKQAKNEAAQTALEKAFGLERTNPPKVSSSVVSLDKSPEVEFGDFIAR